MGMMGISRRRHDLSASRALYLLGSRAAQREWSVTR
jgi:hypothetical protein